MKNARAQQAQPVQEKVGLDYGVKIATIKNENDQRRLDKIEKL
jgi:hypothetical protein